MELERAVKNTIGYATKFKSWVNKNEISKRLISSKKFDEKEIEEVIKQVVHRNKKNRYYKSKFDKAVILAKKIKIRFKDILFLGVSGSVATGHPKKDDDIDFFDYYQIKQSLENQTWFTLVDI